MKRLQVPILAIVLIVAACAMAFTALRTASKLWYGALYTFTAFLLLTAVLAARFRRGYERAFWFGFAVFGWGFFFMGLGPWMNPFAESDDEPGGHTLNPNLLTTRVILYLLPYLRKGADNLAVIDAITENTIGIAHLLMTLTLALAGGAIAVLFRRRPRGRTSVKTLVIVAGLALIASVATSLRSASQPVRLYTNLLAAMGEPEHLALSERNPDGTAYRLLWSPTFHHPVCVRIERTGDGTRLRVKVLDGQGGYEPGQIAIDRSLTVSAEQWNRLERLVEAGSRKRPPPKLTDDVVMDGDRLIIEGVRGGKKLLVGPNLTEAALEELCRCMLELTGIDMRRQWAEYHPPPSPEDPG